MSLVNLISSVATGPWHRRAILTPAGLLFGIGYLLLPVFAALYTDATLGLPSLLPRGLGMAIGLPLLAAGVALHAWSDVLFARAKGTGIPFDPPRAVVTVGPYAWVRNPMLIAVFAGLLGVGFLLVSVSMVLVWTPVFVVLNAIELKLVEEPELDRRLGIRYSEYRRRVPMFIPRAPRRP
jgi:protein-S-isoprenylcysteine O-methyltransferase Ste14